MRTIVLLVCSLVLAGCQPSSESADAGDQVEAVEEVTENTPSSRPDPNAPVGGENVVPPDWVVRLDRPSEDVTIGADSDAADIFFVNMSPGWHITSGPSAIYYHPASTASGAYSAKLDVYLFDPGERNEAFGMFVGGENLDADNQAYDYFLIRNTGEYLIKRRLGSETEVIQDWTAHEAIKRYTAESESSVLNALSVAVDSETVTFFINDMEVTSVPAASVNTDGVVGLRVNHALNLHVSNLAVTDQDG